MNKQFGILEDNPQVEQIKEKIKVANVEKKEEAAKKEATKSTIIMVAKVAVAVAVVYGIYRFSTKA